MAQRIEYILHATSSTFTRQCVTTSTLFLAGDLIAQQAIERRGRDHDVMRSVRLITYGGLIFTPIMSVWLGRVLDRVPIKNKAGAVFAKTALDQTLAAPTVTAVFLSSMVAMQGGGPDEMRAELKQKWFPTLKAGWLVWIPVQAINMSVVPAPHRLLFVNTVNIFWNTFLSIMAGSKPEEIQAIQ